LLNAPSEKEVISAEVYLVTQLTRLYLTQTIYAIKITLHLGDNMMTQ